MDRKITKKTDYPLVSLLVAMKNEEKYIAKCLESILAQDYPHDKIEILILDGLSTDGSWDIVEDMSRIHTQIQLLKNPKQTQSAGWNMGIDQSHGEIITIVSAHSILTIDYVSKAVGTYYRTGADLVGGPVKAIGEDIISNTISLATSKFFGIGGSKFHLAVKEEVVDTVFMGFCNRSLYETIGGFDEEMVRDQDDEFSYRILDNNGTIICNPEIKSYYYSRATLKSLWKQYYQYGFYKVRVLQKHPKQMRLRQYIPPTFVFFILLSILSTFLHSMGWIFLVSVIGSYIIANLTASSITAAKTGWKYFPYLSITFTILHVSYGLGFLAGLIKFWNRWSDKQGSTPTFTKLSQS